MRQTSIHEEMAFDKLTSNSNFGHERNLVAPVIQLPIDKKPKNLPENEMLKKVGTDLLK